MCVCVYRYIYIHVNTKYTIAKEHTFGEQQSEPKITVLSFRQYNIFEYSFESQIPYMYVIDERIQ